MRETRLDPDAVDATALNAFAVAFGNFRRGYILCDHAAAGMRVSVDDTQPGRKLAPQPFPPSLPLSVELRLT